MGALLLILMVVLPAISVIGAWAQADEVGLFVAALPIPLLILLVSIPTGIYMMNTNDGTDMRQFSGFLGLVGGVLFALVTFGLGYAAGYLKLRRFRRP